MKTGTGQERKAIVIVTGDSSLAGYYGSILEEDYEVTVTGLLPDSSGQPGERAALLIIDPQQIDGDLNDSISTVLTNNPGTRLIMVEGTGKRRIDQHALFKTGVHGFCKSNISTALLNKAVQLVLDGEYWIQRKLITRVISELAKEADTIVSRPDSPDDSLISTLTPRELQVARMVHMGGNNKMIARELDISERTVKAHLSAIFRKLDIENRLHLALFFSNKG